jgi:hypothetical protein
VVHGSANAVFPADFVDGVNFVTVKQDTLGKGGFPRVDMRTNSNVPHLLDVRPGNVDAHFYSYSLQDTPEAFKTYFQLNYKDNKCNNRENIVRFARIFKRVSTIAGKPLPVRRLTDPVYTAARRHNEFSP